MDPLVIYIKSYYLFVLTYKMHKIKYFFSIIKVWDLRKTSCQVNGNREPLPVFKYFSDKNSLFDFGYMDMIINNQSTHLYASGTNNIIYCFLLDSLKKGINITSNT